MKTEAVSWIYRTCGSWCSVMVQTVIRVCADLRCLSSSWWKVRSSFSRDWQMLWWRRQHLLWTCEYNVLNCSSQLSCNITHLLCNEKHHLFFSQLNYACFILFISRFCTLFSCCTTIMSCQSCTWQSFFIPSSIPHVISTKLPPG